MTKIEAEKIVSQHNTKKICCLESEYESGVTNVYYEQDCYIIVHWWYGTPTIKAILKNGKNLLED